MNNFDDKKRRTNELRVRCNDEEKKLILANAKAAGRIQVAQWMREICLGVGTIKKDRSTTRSADPSLIAAVNRVGNNLNQIARRINSVDSSVSAAEILASLQVIEEQMGAIIEIESRRDR